MKYFHLQYMILVNCSDNAFSGDIPDELLLLPNIDTIVLSKNCFVGTLPSTICHASQLRNLVLDGLSTSKSCHQSKNRPIARIHGSSPDCIWNLEKIKSIHLSGRLNAI